VTILLPTKFYLPPLPSGFVARPTLMEMLDQAVTHRLTLVSAPAGAGKTLLVSAWAHSRRYRAMPFGWLSLDQGDNAPGVFLEYLAASLEEWGTVIDTALLSSRIEDGAKVGDILRDFIRGIINYKRPLILILDDYHLIQNNKVHGLVDELLAHACPPLHLVILTRSDPPVELARLRVAGQLAELRMEHLRFSDREAGEFLKRSGDIRLADEDIAVLNERTEGWVAGLQMAAISLRGREDGSAFVAAFAGSHRFVFDYLFEEVLNSQPLEVREFLLRTSILERLTASLCDVVAGTRGAAAGMLDLLERNNLFLVPLEDDRTWFRYHHLFASLLQKVLEQTNPDSLAEFHSRACFWYEEQGMLPEALHHALEACDMEMAARMVSTNVLVLVEHAELTPILLDMEAVPQERRVSLPWLAVAHAWGLAYAGQMEKAGIELSLAEKQAAALAAEERSRLRGHITAVRAYLAWSNGDQRAAVAYAEEAAGLIPPEEIAVRALNLTTLGNALSQYGADPRAIDVLTQAMQLARQAGQAHVFMMAATAMAYACVISGYFHRAHAVCEEATAIAEAYQHSNLRSLTASASVYAFLSRILTEWGETEKAMQAAHKGLALSEQWGQADTIMVCLLYLARTLAFAGEAQGAAQVLQRARRLALKITPWHLLNVEVQELEALLDAGNLDVTEVALAVQRKQAGGINVPDEILARLLLRQNHPDEALRLLEGMLPKAAQNPSYENARIVALQALAYSHKKDSPRALDVLEQAFSLAEPENRLATFVREGEAMEKLLASALRKTSHKGFVQRLLDLFEAHRKYKAEPITARETLIEPLSARELEILAYLNGYLSAVEIAQKLFVSVNTVRTHMKSIYGKLDVHGRSQAVRKAKEIGLLK
jgi:LuxR family transcriptional regulator, maltose regulon positive regulatory protein